jgi:hypothetical protein
VLIALLFQKPLYGSATRALSVAAPVDNLDSLELDYSSDICVDSGEGNLTVWMDGERVMSDKLAAWLNEDILPPAV